MPLDSLTAVTSMRTGEAAKQILALFESVTFDRMYRPRGKTEKRNYPFRSIGTFPACFMQAHSFDFALTLRESCDKRTGTYSPTRL